MEKQESRLKKQDYIIVYVCPFCPSPQYFNTEKELARHISENIEHTVWAIHSIVLTCKKEVSKTQNRWMIKCK